MSLNYGRIWYCKLKTLHRAVRPDHIVRLARKRQSASERFSHSFPVLRPFESFLHTQWYKKVEMNGERTDDYITVCQYVPLSSDHIIGQQQAKTSTRIANAHFLQECSELATGQELISIIRSTYLFS